MSTSQLPVLERLFRAKYWLKVAGWIVLLPASGGLCLHHGLLGPAVLLGILGLAVGLRLTFALDGWRRRTPLLAVVLFQLLLLIGALWMLARPLPGGWQRLPATSHWSDPTLLVTGDGVLVAVTGNPNGSFWSDDGGRTFRPHGLPGYFGFVVADDARRGWVWVGTAQGDVLNMYDRGNGRWLQLPRPAGHVWGIALSEERVFIALGAGGLHMTADHEHAFRAVHGIGHCTGVATAPDDEQRLLAVGRNWFASSDGGRHWNELTSPVREQFTRPSVALGGGGWSYVYEGGLLRGTLVAAGPGGKDFRERPLPAGSVRVLVADAEDGRELWLGSWGQGIFHSRDGGEHWDYLGLKSIEVRSLAVDTRHRRVYAASANLLLRRGVYVRAMPPSPIRKHR